MLLTVKDLRVHYGKAEALKGISIEVDEGDLVSIIGANGAGKSTILKAVSGLVRPSSGEIWFKGKRIDGLPPSVTIRRGIAHIPEGRMLFSTMTVLDNLKMGAYIRKNMSNVFRDIESIYQRFPVLAEKHKKPAWSLSGGQQQMLAIARGMMSNSDLMLLDEPSTGLSPILVKELSDTLRKFNNDGKSIMLVEQNARMALKLAKKAYLLEVGSIVVGGKASELSNDDRVKRAYLGG